MLRWLLIFLALAVGTTGCALRWSAVHGATWRLYRSWRLPASYETNQYRFSASGVVFRVACRVTRAGPLEVTCPLSRTDGDALVQEVDSGLASGDDFLFRLQPFQAAEAYRTALKGSAPLIRGKKAAVATYGLARAHAELGEFDEALRWMAAYPQAAGPGCGNCREGRAFEARVLTVVWQAARLEPAAAERELRRIRAGRFGLWKSPLGGDRRDYQRAAAKQEAGLTLAELLVRWGRRDEGVHLMRHVAAADPGTLGSVAIRLAQSHLRRIAVTPSMKAGDRGDDGSARPSDASAP